MGRSVQNSNKPQSTFKCAHALLVIISALLTLYLIELHVFIYQYLRFSAHRCDDGFFAILIKSAMKKESKIMYKKLRMEWLA